MKVERRIDLVYGGGSVGLMGLVSQAAHDGGRHVLGYVSLLSLLSLSKLLAFVLSCRSLGVSMCSFTYDLE